MPSTTSAETTSAAATRKTDVVIVGLGPVGTVLAGLLGRRGLTVTVLERTATVFPLPRAAHIDHTGLRAVQELGCLDQVLPSTIPNPGIEFIGQDGDLLMRQPADMPTWSGVPTSVYFHQPGFDTALRAAVAELPEVELRLETEAVAVVDEGDVVRVTTRDLRDGSTRELEAGYVVACDGATSPVREMLGIDLEDLGFHERWLVVDLLLEGSGLELPQKAVYHCQPARPHVVIPMPGNRHRIECKLLPAEDSDAVQQPAAVAGLLEELVAGGGSLTVERAAVYTFHGLIAQEWRRGRILLAGDAAHQMPPFLGQGMCSGFRDAMNLAWKLHHVLRRGAPEALLDTYQDERSPHVRAIVERAIEFGALVAVLDPQKAADRDRRVREDHSALLFRLPLLGPGPLVLAGGGRLFGQPTIGGELLDDVVGSRFLVLARDAGALGSSAAWWRDALGAWVTTLDELVDPDPSLRAWFDQRGTGVVVVRPDRYVLAASGDLDEMTAAVRPLLAEPAPIPAR
jgi:3-(3-hydroxy-phenyl)propionate hydroxylase